MAVRLSLRLVAVVAGLVAVLTAAGCAGDTGPSGGQPSGGGQASGSGQPSGRGLPTSAPATRTADMNVIDFAGVRGIAFGASLRELGAAGTVVTDTQACGPAFTAIETASPVFDADRLVLIWADPPLRTPEGVMVGTSVEEAKRAYPSAIELTPAAGSTTYPGLLVTGGGDRAYLLLYAEGQVQKLIVGLERYARLLFDTGFGTC